MWLLALEQSPLYVHGFYLFQLKTALLTSYFKEILKKMYDFNMHADSTGSDPQSSNAMHDPQASGSHNAKTKSIHEWGGPTTRQALHAIYTLAFICLLHSDKVLKICWQDLELVKEDDGTMYMIVHLPFCKTHQDGCAFLSFFECLPILFIV